MAQPEMVYTTCLQLKIWNTTSDQKHQKAFMPKQKAFYFIIIILLFSL